MKTGERALTIVVGACYLLNGVATGHFALKLARLAPPRLDRYVDIWTFASAGAALLLGSVLVLRRFDSRSFLIPVLGGALVSALAIPFVPDLVMPSPFVLNGALSPFLIYGAYHLFLFMTLLLLLKRLRNSRETTERSS